MRKATISRLLSLGAVLAAGLAATPSVAQQEPCIGNSAATTGPAAFGGAAIKYGAEVAIEGMARTYRRAARASALSDGHGAPS